MFNFRNPNGAPIPGYFEPAGGTLPQAGAMMPQPGVAQYPYPPQQTNPFPTSTLTRQESYIENILRVNKGKIAEVHMTFDGGRNEIFKGILEAAGRDHIIISDSKTGKRYVLLMVYLDYITFDEEINYYYYIGDKLISNFPTEEFGIGK